MDEKEILEAIGKYKFYHIIQLTDRIATPGWAPYVPAQNLCLRQLESLDVKGKRVLDIGCRDGLFSFKAESMGAAEVIGIDNDLSEPATQLLIPFFKSKVQMKQLNLYNLQPNTFGLFDIVIFPGVLYHLRYPFWGFKIIRDIMKREGHLLIETAIWHGEPDKAMLFCPTGNEGPYAPDSTSCTFFNEKGLRDTTKSLGFETVCIEYLKTPSEDKPEARPIMKLVQDRIKLTIKDVLRKKGFIKKNSLATSRCAFHLIYRGNENLPVMRYWEQEHDMHSAGSESLTHADPR
jgi:tRNA (mo5U34)-methyltransferase